MTSKISFTRINISDAGIYVLTVHNEVSSVERIINVTVQYPPTVTVNLQNGTDVAEGLNLMLVCEAEGVPQIYTYSPWTRHVGEIQVPLYNNDLGRRLQVNGVTFEDQGFYGCSAANGIGGMQENRAEIKIKALPKFPIQQTQAYSALHRNAKIRVGFVSYPAATNITWYKAKGVAIPLVGTDRSKGSRYTYKTTNLKHNFTFNEITVQVTGQAVELEISNVTLMDFQTYLFVVENSIGSSYFTVSLEVADRPFSPVINTPVCGISKADISWISQFNGGYEQTFFVEIKKSGQDWMVHTETFSDTGDNKTISSEILNLEAVQEYSFRVYAENQLGKSYSVEKNCTVLKASIADPRTQTLVVGIVGGVIAGIVVVGVIIVIFLFRGDSKQHQQRTSNLSGGISDNGGLSTYQTTTRTSNETAKPIYENQLSNPDYVNAVSLAYKTIELEPAYEKLRAVREDQPESYAVYENTQI